MQSSDEDRKSPFSGDCRRRKTQRASRRGGTRSRAQPTSEGRIALAEWGAGWLLPDPRPLDASLGSDTAGLDIREYGRPLRLARNGIGRGGAARVGAGERLAATANAQASERAWTTQTLEGVVPRWAGTMVLRPDAES